MSVTKKCRKNYFLLIFSKDSTLSHGYTYSKQEVLKSLEGIVPQESVTEFCYLRLENKSPVQVLHGKPGYQKSAIC